MAEIAFVIVEKSESGVDQKVHPLVLKGLRYCILTSKNYLDISFLLKQKWVVLLLGSGVKRHVGKKACLFKSRGVKRHVVKSQSVNWHAVFRQSMKKGMSPLDL